MSKAIEQLKKAIESYQKKADGITTDYGNTNLTNKRAQQLAENQRKANNLLKVVTVAKTLLQMQEDGTATGNLATVTTGAQIDSLLFDSFPTPVHASDAEWRVKDKNKIFKLLKGIGITTYQEFEAASKRIEELASQAPKAGNSFSESGILLKYPGIRNIPGFFPTPKKLVDEMIELADYEPYHTTWEPGAGFGSIADAVVEVTQDPSKINIVVCEKDTTLATILTEKGYDVKANDMYDMVHGKRLLHGGYDRILMNPPFEKLQDAEHVMHCYNYVKKGGKLVSIMSNRWTYDSITLAKAFRAWADMDEDALDKLKHDNEVEVMMDDKRVFVKMNPDGAFKSSFNKTLVSTLTIVIDKFE